MKKILIYSLLFFTLVNASSATNYTNIATSDNLYKESYWKNIISNLGTLPISGEFYQLDGDAFAWVYIAEPETVGYPLLLDSVDLKTNSFKYIYGKDLGVSITYDKLTKQVTIGDSNDPRYSKIINKTYSLSGYFYQFGSGSFDWYYTDKNKTFKLKLAGSCYKEGTTNTCHTETENRIK